MQGTWLYNSTQMMATLKTAQLKERARRERTGNAGNAETPTSCPAAEKSLKTD